MHSLLLLRIQTAARVAFRPAQPRGGVCAQRRARWSAFHTWHSAVLAKSATGTPGLTSSTATESPPKGAAPSTWVQQPVIHPIEHGH